MVQRQGGSRRKTRHLLKKPYRKKGKISIRDALQELKEGDKVTLVAEPAMQVGLYHRRFHGSEGIVQAKRGECYEVSIRSGTQRKSLVVHPVHLKKVRS